MPNNRVSDYEVILANFLAFVCFWTYYKACAVEPGEIKPSNSQEYVKKYDKYYDNILYKR